MHSTLFFKLKIDIKVHQVKMFTKSRFILYNVSFFIIKLYILYISHMDIESYTFFP